jgi:hypothetical protein
MTADDSTPGDRENVTDSIDTTWTKDGDGARVWGGTIDGDGDVEIGAVAVGATTVSVEAFVADREEYVSLRVSATEGAPVTLSSTLSTDQARDLASRLRATVDELAECRADLER